MTNGEHLPLSISRLTPNRIETATDKAISIAWQDSRDENPYGQAEEFAAFIVRAVNSHEALVEALRAIMSDRMNGPDSYLIWQQARAAIKAAGASA